VLAPCTVFPSDASSHFTHLYISPKPTLRFGLRYILDTFSANDLSGDISARKHHSFHVRILQTRPKIPNTVKAC
jgi:hypothetical protein